MPSWEQPGSEVSLVLLEEWDVKDDETEERKKSSNVTGNGQLSHPSKARLMQPNRNSKVQDDRKPGFPRSSFVGIQSPPGVATDGNRHVPGPRLCFSHRSLRTKLTALVG